MKLRWAGNIFAAANPDMATFAISQSERGQEDEKRLAVENLCGTLRILSVSAFLRPTEPTTSSKRRDR